MHQTTILTLEERTALGTKAVNKIRREGYVPAVMYGHGQESIALMAPYVEVAKVYQQVGKHSPVEVQLAGKKHLAMVKRADIEPVKHRLQHIAFYVVKQNEKVQTEVAVHITGEGETPAEKAGLILIKNVDTVQIEALPRALPEFIEIDGTKLVEAGNVITVGDIVAPEGVTILSDLAQQVASAVEPAALAAANDAAGGSDESEEDAAGDEAAAEAKTEGQEKAA